MAGPSIMVRILGDLTGLQKATGKAGESAEGAASKIHGAFSSVLGQLNQAGVLGPFGESLATVDEAFSKIVEHGKDIGNAMIGVGGALAGVGLGLQALGSKDQAAHQQLQAAVEATGSSYDDYEKKIEAAVKSQEKYGHSASQTQDALRILTTATNSPAKALQLLNTATGLAAAKHESLDTAATSLGKVYNGNTKLLKEFGIVVTKQPNYLKAVQTATTGAAKADTALKSAKQHLADIEALDAGKKKLTTAEAIRLRDAEQKVQTAALVSKTAHQKLTDAQDAAKKSAGKQTDAVGELGKKLSGQAAAQADTFTGKMDALKTKLEDSAAQLGQKYGPALTATGAGLSVLGGAVTTTKGIVDKFSGASKDAKAAVDDVSKAEKGAQTASSLLAGASGIGLILVAIAALILIGYEIYKHWNTIWAGMKAAVKAVWDWIKANWPLLLSILLGPIAAAAYQIYRHWSDIKAGAAAVLHWLQTTWQTVTGYITAPFTAAWQAIARGWDTVVGAIAGLPRRIASAAAGMWNGILGAFRGMVNGIIDIWNGLHFTLPKINAGPIHIGGETIGVPRIPHLAQGGLITGSGIVYAHAGEVISPAPAAGRSGPAVVLQNANFSTEMDVDLFMRKAAWVARTQRI
jgi:hypothetical protein